MLSVIDVDVPEPEETQRPAWRALRLLVLLTSTRQDSRVPFPTGTLHPSTVPQLQASGPLTAVLLCLIVQSTEPWMGRCQDESETKQPTIQTS